VSDVCTAIKEKLLALRQRNGTSSNESKFTDADNDRVDDRLEAAIEAAGYAYDPIQDIFYSTMNAWQREMGYCRLYDEAAVLFTMIIDCEPIYFNYDNKRWLIEFWKGQYALPTGAEIGVYYTDAPDMNIPELYNGPFFHTVKDEDTLQMSFALKKNGQTIFTRKAKHWWLTGFKLGMFSEPRELSLDISITLKDSFMRDAFIQGLINAGYSYNELGIEGNTVSLNFDKPHTIQPLSRSWEVDSLIQWKNKFLCDKYNEIVAPYDNFPDQMKALYEQAPKIYNKVLDIVKTKSFFTKYEKLTNYLVLNNYSIIKDNN
jgi:hypothetical protein